MSRLPHVHPRVPYRAASPGGIGRAPQLHHNETQAAGMRRPGAVAVRHALHVTVVALIAIVTFMAAASGGTAAGGVLTIYYAERPPYSHTLQNGTAAGMLVDASRDILRLTDIQFEFKQMPVPRILQMLDNADHAGAALGFFRTPGRMEKFKFSDAMYDDGPLCIVYTTPTLLQGRDHAELARILEQPGIRIGAMGGYSYGEKADAILKAHGKSMHRITGDTEQLYKMLTAGRINGFLARKPDIDHAAGKYGQGTTHAILQDVPLHQYRYLMFSRNVGNDLIGKVNAAISKLANRPTP
jgi:uncharacterized protein (TIGR02285 family)